MIEFSLFLLGFLNSESDTSALSQKQQERAIALDSTHSSSNLLIKSGRK